MLCGIFCQNFGHFKMRLKLIQKVMRICTSVQKRLIPKVIGTHAKLDWVGHRWISRKLG
jgi:hypothetical protein